MDIFNIIFLILFKIYAMLSILYSYLDRFLINSQVIFYSFFILSICVIIFLIYPKKINFVQFDNVKLGKIFLVSGIILSMLAVMPISGKGYDVPDFIYQLKNIKEFGIGYLFTYIDRPLYYIFAWFLSIILPLPERIIISITGVIGAGFLAFSSYVFTKKAFNNTLIGGLAALFTANMYGITQMSICYITNIFGLSCAILYLSSLIDIFNKKDIKSMVISTILIMITVLVYPVASIISLFIFSVLYTFNIITSRRIIHIKEMFLFILHGSIYLIIISLLPKNITVATSLIQSSSFSLFYSYVVNNTSWESIWIVLPALIGYIFIAKMKINISTQIIISWVVATLVLSLALSTYRDRIIMYMPYSILSAVTIASLFTYIKQKNIPYIKITSILLILMIVPSLRFSGPVQMLRQYTERGPFPWDTVFAEEKQEVWVTQNFDINKIVVVSNIDWLHHDLNNFPKLTVGVFYRAFAEFGSNIYGGNLEDLIRNNYTGTGVLDFPYTENKSFKDRTVIIIDTIYHFSPKDKEILIETSMPGVYIMKEISPMEELDWLMK